MRRGALLLLLAAIALLAAGPARAVLLVTSQGQPVGGKWQRWADGAKVPTVPGHLTFSTDASFCGAEACSWGPPWFGFTRGTAVAADDFTARADLYFELGHQFDWERLTWADRRYLERHWQISVIRTHPLRVTDVRWWQWKDSATSLRLGAEDGMEAIFASIYADCALGENDVGLSIGLGEPGDVADPSVIPKIDTCGYLRRLVR